MKGKTHSFLVLAILMIAGLAAQAQQYVNDFENLAEQNQPWINIHIDHDSVNSTCVCDSTHEYGLGFVIEAGKLPPKKNIHLSYGFQFHAVSQNTQADMVFTLENINGNVYWQSYPLADYLNDTAEWSPMRLDIDIPYEDLIGNTVKCYLWNKGKENLRLDNAFLEINAFSLPSYQPTIEDLPSPVRLPITSDDFVTVVEYINANGDTINDPSVVDADIKILHDNGYQVQIETRFKKDVRLLRLAFVMSLPEGQISVYRRNQHIDSTDLQPSYYLDRGGFIVKSDDLCLSTYHNTGISSLQLDTEKRTACFNIDYWRDHPLLHFPMRTDTSDYFVDLSYRTVRQDEVIRGDFSLFTNAIDELPRIMPVWDGYQCAYIFSEHADWTDISTHRAVLFGNENVTKPKDAVGGFVYFGIPVTKSVFYWNPDNVTNEKTSGGLFPGPHATLMTDKDFLKLMKTLKKQGFEICLHSPEQYTTIPEEFPKAMRFMKKNFGSVTWIDHGYNNGPDKNREDMVCDGLLPESPQYAAALWKEYGVRYLWNAYYEENRMESLYFNGYFVQPYDGFGDALPNRQITTMPDGSDDFLLWSTPSTLEINRDQDWYYFFDSIRLQRLVDNHNVFITHIYPAWTDPYRAYWNYNDNGTAVAKPGFNFALSQIAHFRDEQKMLSTTVGKYLNFYESLLNIDYRLLDDNSIQLTNRGKAIEGLTLLCAHPVTVEGKKTNVRKVDEGYLVWFTLKKNETVIIRQ